jgi:hypothetical protein
MSIGYCKKTRRQFLVGSGKSMLLLPLLPSLLPKEVLAQSAAQQRRMMLFWFDHNNLSNLWPARNAATQAVGSAGVRQSLLSSLGSATQISSVFANNRYQSLINRNQITMLRGFDTAVAYGPGHGNFTLASGAGRNSEGNFPTFDTIIEASRTVYPTTTPSSVRRVMRVNTAGGQAFYQKVGNSVQGLPNYAGYQIENFYNEVFGSLTGGTVPVQDLTNQYKSNILNRVYGSFTSFRSNRRISSEDRARLDQHMSYISDRQNSLASMVPPTPPSASCVRPPLASDVRNNPVLYHNMYFDLLSLAFKCNVSKMGVMMMDAHDPRWISSLNINGQGMHGAIHGEFGNDLQLRAFQNWWGYFTNLIADRFLAPLDMQEGNTGRTYIDNMITGMVCVGGTHGLGGDGGHSGLDSQQILIGSMGGRLRSGNYVNMPSVNNRNMPYNCFLLTLLNLMGVPPSEYAAATSNGQGFGFYEGFGNNHPFASRFYQPITEVLT